MDPDLKLYSVGISGKYFALIAAYSQEQALFLADHHGPEVEIAEDDLREPRVILSMHEEFPVIVRVK
jgi:hypothetical protein